MSFIYKILVFVLFEKKMKKCSRNFIKSFERFSTINIIKRFINFKIIKGNFKENKNYLTNDFQNKINICLFGWLGCNWNNLLKYSNFYSKCNTTSISTIPPFKLL